MVLVVQVILPGVTLRYKGTILAFGENRDCHKELLKKSSSQELVQYILHMPTEQMMKTILLLWSWWDARNKANFGENVPSTKDVIRKATLMQVDVMSLQKHDNPRPQRASVK